MQVESRPRTAAFRVRRAFDFFRCKTAWEVQDWLQRTLREPLTGTKRGDDDLLEKARRTDSGFQFMFLGDSLDRTVYWEWFELSDERKQYVSRAVGLDAVSDETAVLVIDDLSEEMLIEQEAEEDEEDGDAEMDAAAEVTTVARPRIRRR